MYKEFAKVEDIKINKTFGSDDWIGITSWISVDSSLLKKGGEHENKVS